MASATASLLTCFFALTLFMLHSNAATAPSLYHSQSSKTWCVANPAASEDALRANLEFACSESDCAAIQGTGGCSFPDDDGSLPTRASVAMNAYYQARGRNSWNCFFNGTGLITITDPKPQLASAPALQKQQDM
uniref:X8 domain-containing protein n=1 Tax=Oryza barthii TaxID=65489 RepID=A0A0D3GW47_9ORYZ